MLVEPPPPDNPIEQNNEPKAAMLTHLWIGDIPIEYEVHPLGLAVGSDETTTKSVPLPPPCPTIQKTLPFQAMPVHMA